MYDLISYFRRELYCTSREHLFLDTYCSQIVLLAKSKLRFDKICMFEYSKLNIFDLIYLIKGLSFQIICISVYHYKHINNKRVQISVLNDIFIYSTFYRLFHGINILLVHA